MFTGIIALGLYAIALLPLLLSLKRHVARPLFYAPIGVALAVHLYFLYQMIDTPNGQNLNVFNLLSLTTALWVGIVCLANLKSLFWVVLPLAGLSIVGALSVHTTAVEVPLGEHPLALWHILAALAAYALMGVAFLQAMTLALQRHYLSRAPAHRVLPFLPPLEAMQTLMLTVMSVAFVALTVALGFGVLAHGMGNGLFSFKNTLSLGVWLLSAGLLIAYYRTGLKVRYAILGTGLAWLGLNMAYIGMKVFSHQSGALW